MRVRPAPARFGDRPPVLVARRLACYPEDMEPWPRVGSHVPHFTVTTVDGQRRSYDGIWQRSQLLLVVCPEEPDDVWRTFEARLVEARGGLAALETELVITREPVGGPALESIRHAPGGAGPHRPVAVVADRWGEVTHAAALERRGDAIEPDVETLILWATAALHRCPECEGEAR